VILALSGAGAVAVSTAAQGQITAGFAGLSCVFGLAMITALLAFWSRTARWIHLRIREHNGILLGFSFPISFAIAEQGLKIATNFVQDEPSAARLRVAAAFIHEAATSLRSPDSPPLSIQVADDNDEVDIFIG